MMLSRSAWHRGRRPAEEPPGSRRHLGATGDMLFDVVGVAPPGVHVGIVQGSDSYSTWAAAMVTVLVARVRYPFGRYPVFWRFVRRRLWIGR